jgi:Ca2+-binding EF-hand superfamily protein
MALKPEQIGRAFDLFDSNRRGWLPVSDVDPLLRGLGFTDMTDSERSALTRAMDSEGTGRVDRAEFERTLLRKHAAAGSPEEQFAAFQLIDRSGNGISHGDLAHAATSVDAPISEGQLRAAFATVAGDEAVVSFEAWRTATTEATR